MSRPDRIVEDLRKAELWAEETREFLYAHIAKLEARLAAVDAVVEELLLNPYSSISDGVVRKAASDIRTALTVDDG